MSVFFKTILLFAFSAQIVAATTWSELTVGNGYRLTHEINIKNSQIKFRENSFAHLIERVKLEILNLELFKFKIVECSDRSSTANLEIYDFQISNNEILSLGIELAKQCNIEIFLENNDLLKTSILK